jgi:hypothetical protein
MACHDRLERILANAMASAGISRLTKVTVAAAQASATSWSFESKCR